MYEVDKSGHGVVVTSEDRYGRTRSYQFLPGEFGVVRPTSDGYTSGVLKALWNTGVVVDWSTEDIRGPVDIDDPEDVTVRDVTEHRRIAEYV